jgi:predicted anti-sigma-YlaC factor YlaD
MNEQTHDRARTLIASQQIEGLSPNDQAWLNTHLVECESCSAENQRVNHALSALRTMNIGIPRDLASRTQFRVRLRAEELREKEPAQKFIWAIAAVSWALGVATAPWVWRGFEWAGNEFGLPKFVWMAGVALWWLVPGLVAAGLVVLQKRGVARGAE